MREDTLKTFSGSSSTFGPTRQPQTWDFLPKASASGRRPKCSCAHILPVIPKPVWTSSRMKKTSCSRALRSRPCRNSRAEVVVAALALDRLHDDGGDVVGVVGEGPLDLVERLLLSGRDVPLDLRRRGEAQVRVPDARPAELREEVGLDRVGVGEREGVAGAAVERLAQVDDLLALLPGDPLGAVAAHLPVEGGLERVLDPERAAFDEEGVLHVRGLRQPPEDVDEPGVLDVVEVGERGLELRHPVQDLLEVRVLELRVIEADGVRGEEGAEVEDLTAAPGVVDPGAVASLEIDDEIEAVREDVPCEHGVDVGRGDGRRGCARSCRGLRRKGVKSGRGQPWPPPYVIPRSYCDKSSRFNDLSRGSARSEPPWRAPNRANASTALSKGRAGRRAL